METKGLANVVAAETKISSIIGDKLAYSGYDIDTLVGRTTFEEVAYLLWYGSLPTESQYKKFCGDIRKCYEIPESITDYLKSIPLKEANPMGVLRTAVSMLGQYDPVPENMDVETKHKKGINILAKMGTIVAAISRIRKGQNPITPRKDNSIAYNFLYMISGNTPTEDEVASFEKALVLHAEHELNASTFTARVCASTLSDIYSCVTSAIGSLKGPLHGGANEAVMEMLHEIGEFENAEKYIKAKLLRKEKIMGFGHRVYKNGDPRACHLKEMSKKHCALTNKYIWFEMSEKVEEVVLKEKNIPANVDFYSASFYHALGVDQDLFTPIFSISRTAGWIAHIIEQHTNNRIIRPRAKYTGFARKEFVNMSERG